MEKSILYPSKSVDFKPIFLITLFLLLGILNSSVYALPVESGDKRYLDNNDGTITDTKTGLMWMKKDSYLHSGHWLNWYDVHDYVQQLND